MNQELITKILIFDPVLPQLLITDDHLGHEKNDDIIRFLMRFFYVLIYHLEDESAEKRKKDVQKVSVENANKENELSSFC